MQSDVSKWEAGEAQPSYPTVVRIAAVTETDLAVFLSSETDGYKAGLRSAANRLRRVLGEIETEINPETNGSDLSEVTEDEAGVTGGAADLDSSSGEPSPNSERLPGAPKPKRKRRKGKRDE